MKIAVFLIRWYLRRGLKSLKRQKGRKEYFHATADIFDNPKRSPLLFVYACILFASCQAEPCCHKEPLEEAGLKVYNYVEPGLEQLIVLFENSLRLDREILTRNVQQGAGYFPGETVFRDPEGWWGVMNRNESRFKIYPMNEKPLAAEGSVWKACSRYYSSDSIVVECLEPNRWSLKGYTRSSNDLMTEAQMEITCTTPDSSPDWDSVAFYIDVKGISHLTQAYPSRTVDIAFSIIRPLLRREKTAQSGDPFVEGLMKLEATDLSTGKKEQILARIENLPLQKRVIRITARGVTDKD